jgi:hypothetical protein
MTRKARKRRLQPLPVSPPSLARRIAELFSLLAPRAQSKFAAALLYEPQTYPQPGERLNARRQPVGKPPGHWILRQLHVAYQYDEWARSIGRTVDGSANSATRSLDSLGRVSAETNPLGSFTYAYAGATGRLQQITPSPANAPQIYFAYNDTATSGDRRLN